MNRIISILALVILCGLYIISRYIYFNPTPSETIGYYFVYKPIKYNVGDLVLVCISDSRSIYILQQFGLPQNTHEICKIPFLLKKVAAGGGDAIHITNQGIKINDKLYLQTIAIDKYQDIYLNRLPVGMYYKLKNNEFFLLGNSSRSYDSRYFGVVSGSALHYKAKLIWAGKLAILKQIGLQ